MNPDGAGERGAAEPTKLRRNGYYVARKNLPPAQMVRIEVKATDLAGNKADRIISWAVEGQPKVPWSFQPSMLDQFTAPQ